MGRAWALFGLVVRTPRVELRLPTDDELVALADLAAAGIHDPATMPFDVPWTDVDPPELQRNFLQYHWLQRASLTADDWHLVLATFDRGSGGPVGSQGLLASEFAIRRTVATGSWLGRDHQGQGIGTEMRAAVLHLAFAGLGAERAESGAWEDNEASLSVSRALGYHENRDHIAVRRGESARQIDLVLDRSDWEQRRRDDIELVGLDACLTLLGATGGR